MARMRVLVIDDDEAILELIKSFIPADQFEVHVTPEARAGLAWLDRLPFDVLITDVLLPDIDGIEIMKLVRQRYQNMWVIAISGGTARFPANAALKLTELFGANRVLFKPFSRDELMLALAPAGGKPILS